MTDFSPLTDDQLVELVRAACQEAVRRGMHVQRATEAAMLSEAEKARIAQDAAERAAEELRRKEAERIAREAAEAVKRQAEAAQSAEAAQKQQKLWAKKADLARMVADALGGEKATVTVWAKDGEKRVYLDQGRGFERSGGKVSYFATGNHRQAPGSLKLEWKGLDEAKVRAACERAAKDWNSVKFYVADALKAEVAS